MGASRFQLSGTVGLAIVGLVFVGLSVVVVVELAAVGLAVIVLVWRTVGRWIGVVSGGEMCVLEARGWSGWLVGISSCWV
jgi:hypothetical protein